jgi:hypothetical protein
MQMHLVIPLPICHNPREGKSDEALLLARSLFTFAPHRASGGRSALRSSQGRFARQEARKWRRLSEGQSQGPGPRARPRQWRTRDRRPGDRADDRRPGSSQEPGTSPRQRQALPTAAMAQLHHRGIAQGHRPDVQPGAFGRRQGLSSRTGRWASSGISTVNSPAATT